MRYDPKSGVICSQQSSKNFGFHKHFFWYFASEVFVFKKAKRKKRVFNSVCRGRKMGLAA